MLLFHFDDHQAMAHALLKLSCLEAGQFAVNRYANQELCVSVATQVSGEHCVILGSVAPPDDRMLSVMLLAHTLKKEGARRVTGLIPYLAYTRQDKKKPGESIATAWVGSLFQMSGVDDIVTVDVHSRRDKELFPISLSSLSTAELFAEAIRKHGLADATIVAPDNGAIDRCQQVMGAARLSGEVVYCEKQRTIEGITHIAVNGEVGSKAVIIDDMLDTGATLVSACEKLNEKGAGEIYIMVTHGLFTGSQWKKLWALRVKAMFCTDTIALPKELESEPIVTLSVIPLVQTRLKKVNRDAQGTH